MKLSTVALALAATASAGVISRDDGTPRAQPHTQYGYWTITLDEGSIPGEVYLFTEYYNDAEFLFPDGHTTSCVVSPNSDPPIAYPHDCDKLGFIWSFENNSES